MATELLDGEQVVALLWSCFNPTRADGGARPVPAGELLGELDAPVEREEAIQAGLRLRDAIAGASLDFERDSHLAHVDRDAEQTIVVATTAGRTSMGWLHGAMLTRQPFTLCVYVHALERRRERQRLKLAYRRLFTINRGAESRGRVPDFDRYVQEREYEGLLGQLASGQQTGLFHVSIYEKLRARGPDPDLAALSEAVDFCAEQIESAGDCKVNAGTFRQQQLWESTLPLGRDVLAQVRKYPTVNAADMLPLVGTKCGSPTGIPFAFADPGPDRRAAEPLRRAAPQPHAADRRPLRVGQDHVSERADVPVPGARRARVRDRSRRPLRDALAAGRRGAADRDRRRGARRTR